MKAACAAVCAAICLALLAACSSSGPHLGAASPGAPSQPAPTPATTSPPESAAPGQPAPQLTVAQANVAFNAFLPQFDELSTDPSQAGQLTIGPEHAAQTFLNGQGPAAGALTGERFLVPRLTSYPRWFLAAGSAANRQGFLFVMVQQSGGAPWLAAAELYDLSPTPQILPDLSLAGFKTSGLFSPEAASDSSLTTQPSALSAAYARYLDDGARGKAFLPGGYTTSYVRQDQLSNSSARAAGWRFGDVQSAAVLPVYALKFPDGAGALVVFYTRDATSWTAASASARLPTGTSDSGAEPPAQFLHQLRITSVSAGLRVTVASYDENLAFVGPAGAKGATIVVNVGKGVGLTKS
jgi:hypothetical protein